MDDPRSITRIRTATEADLPFLKGIEDDADRLLVDLLRPDVWPGATDGRARAAMPGFLLVAAETPDGEPVGFAHVLEQDGLAHLEQVAVDPAHGRRGHGRALVEASKAAARARGYDRITLRTYADVPWNAPFYTTCGFVESAPDAPFLRSLEASEAREGLERWGRRVQMTALLAAAE